MRAATILLVACALICGCSRQPSVPREVAPVVSYVDGFRASYGRLPSDAEFQDWAAKVHPKEKFEFHPQGTNYIAGGWDGICFVYYQSWDKKTFDGAIR
jgi:hypothetical protein